MDFYMEAKFDRILKDCSKQGWDGYRAEVITPVTVILAQLFSKIIAAYLPLMGEDEPLPNNDNTIGFEFEKGKNWLIVCIGENSCYYASSYKSLPQYKGTFALPEIEPKILIILEKIKGDI